MSVFNSMRLLLVSFAFPPFNSIGGLRVGKTAKYLLHRGHDVRVLTAADQPFPKTLALEVPAENVVYSRYLNVRKPIEGALAERGDTTASHRKAEREAPLRKLFGFLIRTFIYFPDANIGWVPYALKDISPLLKSWRPDLILASSPPPSGLLVARRLARKLNVPWVADLRDLWTDHQYYMQPRGRKLVEQKLEHRVLSSASALVTVSEPLAETLRRKYRKPTAVVLNGFDPCDYPAQSRERISDERLSIVYTGVIYAGRQDPSPLFEALKLMGDKAKGVKVVFYGLYLAVAAELVEQYGIGHLVEVKPPVAYQESLRLQSEADLLLLLLWTDTRERGVYTGKLFEYLGARRPILALGEKENVAAELILKRGAGVVLAGPAEIAAQLLEHMQLKQTAGMIPSPPLSAIEGVTREAQVSILDTFLSQVVNHQPGSDSVSNG
jgi:glycosyltransferase involved in cell wall biosynthesis